MYCPLRERFLTSIERTGRDISQAFKIHWKTILKMGGKESPGLSADYILLEEDVEYLKERYPETLNWLVHVKCAWCGAVLGFKAVPPNESEEVSHGICPDCYLKQIDNLKPH